MGFFRQSSWYFMWALQELSVRSSFPSWTDAHNVAMSLCYEIQQCRHGGWRDWGNQTKPSQAFISPALGQKFQWKISKPLLSLLLLWLQFRNLLQWIVLLYFKGCSPFRYMKVKEKQKMWASSSTVSVAKPKLMTPFLNADTVLPASSCLCGK